MGIIVKELYERVMGRGTVLKTSRAKYPSEVNHLSFVDDTALVTDSL